MATLWSFTVLDYSNVLLRTRQVYLSFVREANKCAATEAKCPTKMTSKDFSSFSSSKETFIDALLVFLMRSNRGQAQSKGYTGKWTFEKKQQNSKNRVYNNLEKFVSMTKPKTKQKYPSIKQLIINPSLIHSVISYSTDIK